jgi:hypothetical protein
MNVLEQHCHSNGRRPPQMRPEPTFLAHQMMQGVVFEEWWEVWAMDGEWQASSGRINVRGRLFSKLKSYKIEG